MDIGTNELTRPFRIPRRRADESSAADGIPDKVKRHHFGNQSDLRSPLASTSSVRKSDSAFSSRIVPPTKKKAAQDHPQIPTHSRKSKPGELFDRILDSMVNPPKERKKDPPQDDVEEAGPSVVVANTSNSPPKRTTGLTREDLERHQNDDSSCYAFMQREGLMERLLGHKMLTGRVDSHVVLGFLPFDPKDNLPCRNHKNSSSKVDDFPTICEPPPVAVANEEKRGPKTPPGSPGHYANSSVLSSRGIGSASPSSPPPPPPADENVENGESSKVKVEEGPDLIAEMAELTKLPHNQLAECLGEELQKAMKQVDHKVLLETLKDALSKVGKKNDDHQDGPNQTVFKEDIHVCPVEMDLESNKSVSGNGVLLPPPPPAPSTPPSPNMVTALPVGLSNAPVVMAPAVLPTPPPPPPLVMLHPGTASQVLVNTSGTGNASSLYPYFPPPPPHQLNADQSVSPATIAGSQTSAAGSVIFPSVPYATNLVATSLAAPTAQPAGIVGAFQNIPVTLSHIAATPAASAAAPYTNQTPAFALYPNPSAQQLPQTTTAFSSGSHHPPAVVAHSNPYSSSNINVSNNSISVGKSTGLLPPAVLHPYASATNYNITSTSTTPYSIPTTSCVVTTASGLLTTATVSSLQQQLQQTSKPLVASNSSFSCGPNLTETGPCSTANNNCSFSNLRTSQNTYYSQYQTTNYSPPVQQHQHQKQSHQNPNFSGASSDGAAGAGGFVKQHQQLQSDEKSFCTNFSRPSHHQMQTSLESLPTSSNVTFNGGEAGSSRFLTSNTSKAESVPMNAITSVYSSNRSLVGAAITNTSTSFGGSKSSADEPVSVPSSQNVIKTLLSALSIPHSSDSATVATGGVTSNHLPLVPEISDADREVDFCWPPANMDARWSDEQGPSVSDKTKKTVLHQPPLSGSQMTNTTRMKFFDQPTKAPASPVVSRTGIPMARPRPPIPPPIQSRLPLNRLPRGLPASSTIPGLLSGGLRARPLFRPSGLAASQPFPAVPPLRPRISPPFFARRQPFPMRPTPPGIRQARPSYLR